MIKINENLFNNIIKIDKKDKYPNINIKNKRINSIDKNVISNSMETTPFEFSISLEQKSNKIINNINNMNIMSFDINKNTYKSKLMKKYKQLFNRNNNENIRNKLFNRITSMNNDFLENGINKEKKNNTSLLKSFDKVKDKKGTEDKNNNVLIIHKKFFSLCRGSNKKSSNVNIKNQKKNKTTSLLTSDSAKRYKTVFIKCKMDKIKLKDKSQEPVQKFELFSPKYNNNLDESKGNQTPRKLFTNDEIKKTEFHNHNLNNNYIKTDSSYKSNSLSILLPKLIQIPNIENVKNFKKIYKPTFYIQKNDVKKKISLMFEQNKNNPFHKRILLSFNKEYKNRNNINIRNTFLNKMTSENNSKIKGIKYISVNLNNLVKIPNRLIPVDKYGKQIKHFISYKKKKILLSQSDAFERDKNKKLILIKNKIKK